jgi:hypothetical protein
MPATPPPASVATAATTKDQIDADIQLAALKSMSRPTCVHIATHHEI